MKFTAILLASITATQLHAQAASSDANPMVAATRGQWQNLANYIAKAAEQMPEADYAFKPTPEVRSFGQLIGHLADGQNVICNAALAENSTAKEGDIENNVKAKADLIAAFKKSTDLCARAYAQSDAVTTGMAMLFGANRTRFEALVRNAVHDGEHYGNIVTYFRLKGMVPPSSQPPPTTPSRE